MLEGKLLKKEQDIKGESQFRPGMDGTLMTCLRVGSQPLGGLDFSGPGVAYPGIMHSPALLPLPRRTITGTVEATVERKTAAHVMALWK
ncbi:hypothetical protein GDO78_020486 [Eleutherodactylus coqui]|uniref:Uncharacterized protein n=1 Tax=Eleutherodactylus coqui TaxID=57060 RepID=A0A8J6BFM4_ELECQ|nr:hypothetical protein GDO78_020486 [Eleutherodactylus coqui]